MLYARDGRAILDSYRASADASLHDFDWQKAEVYLERAVQLGAADDGTLGELALSKGYATLQRLEGGRYSDEAAAQLRLYARDEFRTAAAKMPQSAEPHLALARAYVYALPIVDSAMAEFSEAQKLGATLGRREIEEQGDAYRQRAAAEAGSSPKSARADAARARAFYERVRGFDRVEAHLKEVARLQRAGAVRQASRSRRWR